jgi:hypothetical protein
VDAYFEPRQAQKIKTLFSDRAKLDSLPVNDLMAALVTQKAP